MRTGRAALQHEDRSRPPAELPPHAKPLRAPRGPPSWRGDDHPARPSARLVWGESGTSWPGHGAAMTTLRHRARAAPPRASVPEAPALLLLPRPRGLQRRPFSQVAAAGGRDSNPPEAPADRPLPRAPARSLTGGQRERRPGGRGPWRRVGLASTFARHREQMNTSPSGSGAPQSQHR